MSLTNTQWVQIKTPSDIVLEGVNVELDRTDTTVNSIIVRDVKGNALRVLRGEYSGMRAMVANKYGIRRHLSLVNFRSTSTASSSNNQGTR